MSINIKNIHVYRILISILYIIIVYDLYRSYVIIFYYIHRIFISILQYILN